MSDLADPTISQNSVLEKYSQAVADRITRKLSSALDNMRAETEHVIPRHLGQNENDSTTRNRLSALEKDVLRIDPRHVKARRRVVMDEGIRLGVMRRLFIVDLSQAYFLDLPDKKEPEEKQDRESVLALPYESSGGRGWLSVVNYYMKVRDTDGNERVAIKACEPLLSPALVRSKNIYHSKGNDNLFAPDINCLRDWEPLSDMGEAMIRFTFGISPETLRVLESRK